MADSDGSDIPFHCNFRFDENKVVLNSYINGVWGEEQRENLKFKAGEEFDVRIRAHEDKFEILCKQKECCQYEYRVPLSQVTHVNIAGQIELTTVLWGGRYYPIPYNAGIRGGLGQGRRLYLSGKPTGNEFRINLKNDQGDIALHFNVRFDEDAIVRNTLKDGEWLNEEREGELKLTKSKEFDIVLANESYAFQCYCDNERFCSFAHRMDPDNITSLEISGDVEMNGIHIM